MAKFSYALDIGEYNAPVHVDIEVRIENGLSAEDYNTVREALKTVEDTARKYLEE